MDKYKILNSRELKKFQELVEKQFGARFPSEYVFLENGTKFYISNREVFDFDASELRVNSLGLYIAEVKGMDIRLSVEGSQMIGPNATKNVLSIDDSQLKEWLRGNELESSEDFKGFVIIKHDNDFFACGKNVKGRILNYLPKTRRINCA